MTIDQILEKYKKQFIIVIETAGEILKNDSYKNIEKILSENSTKEGEDLFKERNAPFSVFIVFYISLLLSDIYGPETVSQWDNITERKECRDLYKNYIKEFTDRFTSKYGLEKVDIEDVKFLFRLK